MTEKPSDEYNEMDYVVKKSRWKKTDRNTMNQKKKENRDERK